MPSFFLGGIKVALDVGWEIGRDEVNNDISNVDLANGQQHVVTVKRFNKGRGIRLAVSIPFTWSVLVGELSLSHMMPLLLKCRTLLYVIPKWILHRCYSRLV